VKLGPYELGPNDTPENGIYCGDARELSLAIPDESVDLIFADPVYQNIDDYRWLAECGARVLQEGGNALIYCAHVNLPDIILSLESSLTYRWLFIQRKFGLNSRMWGHHLYGCYIPLLWYSNGKGFPTNWTRDVIGTSPRGSNVNHAWMKSYAAVNHWIPLFSADYSVVLDPFTGGGTVPAVCKMLSR